MRRRGDVLLYAVAAQRRLTWRTFSDALDTVFVPDERVGTNLRYARMAVASFGDALGHWDVGPEGEITIAPPVLARLPWPGRPRAVLCGSRSPDTLPALRAASRRTADIDTTSLDHVHPCTPTRVEVVADSVLELTAVADRLGIDSPAVAPAWALALFAGAIDTYIASLVWETGPELNWPRRDFDVDHLRLSAPTGAARQQGLSLSAYTHPQGWAWQDRLWRDGNYAVVDRSWGRYAVLAERRVPVLNYDRLTGRVTVPRQVPLPRVHARSLTLCSGQPPALVPGAGLGSLEYDGVPQSVFQALAARLGQYSKSETTEHREEP